MMTTMKKRTIQSAILCVLMLVVVFCGFAGVGTLSLSAAEGEASHTDAADHEYSAFGVCTCGETEPAVLVTNDSYASLGLTLDYVGYYAVGNYGQFLWIRDHINSGNPTTNFVLTADIDFSLLTDVEEWVPITDFGGIFDGGFHRIKNLNLNYVGAYGVKSTLFYRSRTSTYRNAIIDGSCYFRGLTAPFVSIIQESSFGEEYSATLTFANCGNEATVKGGSYSAGLALINNVHVSGSFTNCYNAGNVSGATTHGANGFTNSRYFQFYNCYNSGTITAGASNAHPFSSQAQLNNCHDYSSNPNGFASGEVAYLLSEGVTVNDEFHSGAIWGQDLTVGEGDTHTDALPVLGGARVYLCNGYSNVDEHVFDRYDSNNDMHWMECSCGEQSDTAPVAHTHDTRNYDETNHWNECACGHQADVAPHVTEEWEYDGESHWKPCSGCDIDTIASGPHDHSEEWTADAESAYHLCECGHKADVRALSYSVTFHKNNGVGEMANTTFSYSAETNYEYTLPACELIRANHSFDGWLVSVGGVELGIKQAGEKLDVNGNVELTAQWSIIFLFETDPAAKTDLVYNGLAQVLITEGTVNAAAQASGTVKYRIGIDGEWSTALPAATNAGSYNVYYGIFEGENGPYEVGEISVTITAKSVTATIDGLESPFLYPNVSEEDPAEQGFVVKVDGVVIDPSNYSVFYADHTAVGTATVMVTAKPDGNYIFDSVQATYVIIDHRHEWEYSVDPDSKNVAYATCVSEAGVCDVDGRVVTLTLVASDATYDGMAHGVALTADQTFELSHWAIVYHDESGNSSLYPPVAAGTYTAEVAFGIRIIQVEYTIHKMEIELEWSNTNLTYNGAVQAPSAKILTELPEGAATAMIEIVGEWIDAGSYTVTAIETSGNYRIINSEETLTIAPHELTLIWSNTEMIYNGEEQLPSAVLEVGPNVGDTVNVTVELKGIGSAISVNEYVAIASIDNGNYVLTNPTQSFTIEKLIVPVLAIPSAIYNGEVQRPEILENDLYTVQNEGGTNAGEYDVVLTLKDSNNYKWADTDEASVTLTFVIERQILDEVDLEDAEYNGEAQLPELLTDVPYTLVTSEGVVAPGNYEVVLRLTDSVNYAWAEPHADDETLTTATFTITKLRNEWLVVPSIRDWRFGETPSVPEYEATYGNDGVKIRYRFADGEETETVPTEIGSYVAIFTVEENDTCELLTYETSFEVKPPRMTIGGWALPALHYMDTFGLISETQPAGGYAYMRADGVLVLNNFVIDASVFEELTASEDPAVLEKLAKYRHLHCVEFSTEVPEDSEKSGPSFIGLIQTYIDTEILLLGNNALAGCGETVAIYALAGDLRLRGDALTVDSAVVVAGRLEVEHCEITFPQMVAGGSAYITSSVLKGTGESSVLLCGELMLEQSTLVLDAVMVSRNATLNSSDVTVGMLMVAGSGEIPSTLEVYDSRVQTDGQIGISASEMVAEGSVFVFRVSQGMAINADDVTMTDCEITVMPVKAEENEDARAIGFIADWVMLTDCKVTAEGGATLFRQGSTEDYGSLMLDGCEIFASSTEGGMGLIAFDTVYVIGGKLTLQAEGLLPVISCTDLYLHNAEIVINSGDAAINGEQLFVSNTKLTVTQSENPNRQSVAILGENVSFSDSTVVIKGGMNGIYAPNLTLGNTKLDIVLGLADDAAVIQPLIPVRTPEGGALMSPVYVGILANYSTIFGEDMAITVTIPKGAEGYTVVFTSLPELLGYAIEITAPEGADFEFDGEQYYTVVLRDGESVTRPTSVTIAYEESEGDIGGDTEEIPEEREDAVVVGGVALSDGDYLDNNGKVSKQKPEGGYAHLSDGVLTLNGFVYCGVGYLYDSYVYEDSEFAEEYHAGIYSTNSLTVRVLGKNLFDLTTFAGECYTDGIVIWNGELSVEGYGTLELLATDYSLLILNGGLRVTNTSLPLNSYNYVAVYADGDVTFDRATVVIHSLTDDGIEIYGDLTATDSAFDFTVGDVGFDIYGNALFERCEILLNAYDDGIWVDEDLTMVDCTVEISSEDDDSISVYGDATVIDCTLKLKSDEDGLDVSGKLNMHSCDVSVDAGDTAIEVGVESGSSVYLYDSGLTLKSKDTAVQVYGSLEIVGCTVSIATLTLDDSYSDDAICGISAENLLIFGCTVSIQIRADDCVYETYLYGISADEKVEIRDSSVSVVAGNAMCDGSCVSYGFNGGDVLVSDSVLNVEACCEAFCVENVEIRFSELDIVAEETAFCVDDEMILVGCYGSILAWDYDAFYVNDLSMEQCSLSVYAYDSMAIYAYGSVEIVGGSLELYACGLIEAEEVVLTDCTLYLQNESSMYPSIYAPYVEIGGDDLHIYSSAVYGAPFMDAMTVELAPEIRFEDPNGGEEPYLDEYGYVQGENGILDSFYLFAVPEDSDDFYDEEPTLIIGDKEIHSGEYLDNEGNITDTVPAGGFAYFDGSVLYLKSFTYEGIGTTLTSLNGETVTIGVYFPGSLSITLIGENKLTFTSENTVGITIGDGDLNIVGSGSLALSATGKGIDLLGGLFAESAELRVSAAGVAIKSEYVSLVCATVSIQVSGESGAVGIMTKAELDVTESTLTVNVTGISSVGISVAELTVLDSTLNVTAMDAGSVGILVKGLLTVQGKYVDLTVDGEAGALTVGETELDETLAILTPEGAILLDLGNGTYAIANADGSIATKAAIGVGKPAVEAQVVEIGGVELRDGEYIDNGGTISVEQPEGGYAYFKDGVLTLNSFTYSGKKYNVQIGIYSNTDLTLTLIGENLISTYGACGVSVEGDLTLTGDGCLTVDCDETGIGVTNTLTVFCDLTVNAGLVAVEARDVSFLSGEISLAVTEGEAVVTAFGSITVGERLTVSAPEGARIVRDNRLYVFTDAYGKQLSALTLTWALHDCTEGDAIDHLCGICGEIYPTCTDENTDHICDACGGEVGYHADTNSDHACEYGCGVSIGICADGDNDHRCDYGCEKTFGECQDVEPKDHKCDYGCGKTFGNCADNDRDHACDYGCSKVFGECKDADTDHHCDYGCDKTFGECQDVEPKDHKCDYGCGKTFGNCADNDRDHACDYGCSKAFGECKDADTDHHCDYGCVKTFGECQDVEPKDHKCDYGCGKTFGNCADNDRDHACDYGCSQAFGECKDADTDHHCDYGCVKTFGEHKAADGAHGCAYCKVSITECSDDESDHVCDVCKKELTHTYSTDWKKNALAHWHECTCGDVADIAAHTPGAAATETTAQICTVCGYIIAPATGHVSHTPKTEWASDDSYHWHECTNCGTQKMDMASHAYDHACDTDCNVCGKVRTVTHDYHTAWSKDASKHWHECRICGDKKDEATHTNGAAATETTPQTCTVCGYIIASATGHTSHTPKKEWSSNATHHWNECTGCSDQEINKTAHSYDNDCDADCNVCERVRIVTHDYQTEWSKDENRHWNVCGVCGEKANEVEHSFGNWTVTKQPTANEDGSREKSCLCGTKVTESIPATGGEEPATGEGENTNEGNASSNPGEGEEKQGLPAGAIVAIAAGSTVVLGAGGFALWWFAIAPKTGAQLLGVCKASAGKGAGFFKGLFEKIKTLFSKK